MAPPISKRPKGYGGPYNATYAGGLRYERKPGKPECLWLFFELDDDRKLPFKGYLLTAEDESDPKKIERKRKAVAECLEAIGYEGDIESFDPKTFATGARVKVKCWRLNDGTEASVTWVNLFEGKSKYAPEAAVAPDTSDIPF